MIHINSNDPEHMKARQNVKPLTMEEEKDLVDEINTMINLSLSNRDWVPGVDTDNIQRLIYRYENLKHLEATAVKTVVFKGMGKSIDDFENYNKAHFTHEVNLQTGEEKIVELGNWIDVKDILPEEGVNVLLYDNKEDVTVVGSYNTGLDTVYFKMFYAYSQELENVTHWQPLPEPPKTLKFNIPKP